MVLQVVDYFFHAVLLDGAFIHLVMWVARVGEDVEIEGWIVEI